MNWTMQGLLVAAHQDNLTYLAHRLPKDVEHFSGTGLAVTGLQPAINNLMYEDVFVWATSSQGEILAQSTAMSGRTDDMTQLLLNMAVQQMPGVEIYEVDDRYFVFCQEPLIAKGTQLGWIHIAKDITADQKLLMGLTRSLTMASILALSLLTLAITYYIRRALQPLNQISQLANTISADDLGQARLQLDVAPTEVQDLAQTLERMLLRLSDSWQQQRQFVSNVSHEFRTPLTIVDGYLQSVLRRGQNLTELQREGLEMAANEAQRTIRLLQDLLDLARADNGHIHLHAEPLCLDDVATEVVAMAQISSDRTIHITPASEPVWILGDRDRLKQILINLMDNAVLYSPPPQPIYLQLDQGPQEGQIKVIDQGPGISLPHQLRIFDRFYRIDEARSRNSDDGGTGLGLSIVKTLVEAMAGKVEVQSQLGQGSTFIVTLPRSDPSNLPSVAPSPNPVSSHLDTLRSAQ
jgi:signal transduction histidine kinase